MPKITKLYLHYASFFRTRYIIMSCAARAHPDWQRSGGRPCTTWVHHSCADINTPALDALR